MSTATLTTGRPARKRRSARPRALNASASLGLGVGLLWFSLLVLIPLSAVVVEASGGGWSTYRSALTNSQTVNALQLTVGVAAADDRHQHGDGHDHRLGAGA